MAKGSIFRDEKSDIVVTCPPGVAPTLAAELSALGFARTVPMGSSVATEGTLADCVRLNLRLRTAHRVLYALDVFRARTGDDLYEEAFSIPWERYLDPDGYVSVDRAVDNPTIRDSRFAALKVKDAIADRMRSVCGRRPDSGSDRTDACVFLHWAGNRASIYLDTTGVALSFRGYRVSSSEAPLRETLAAALVMASEWNGRDPFLNPMCGGATIAIEAAWIAQNRAPALVRENFAFLHLACFEPAVLTAERARAFKDWEEGKRNAPAIIASDLDPAAAGAAAANAAEAGLQGAVEIECSDVLASTVPPVAPGGRGMAVLNPPYGGRIGDPVRLRDTYEDIGAFLAKAAAGGYGSLVITGNPELAEEAGLKSDRVRAVNSGGLDCAVMFNPSLSAKGLRRFRIRNPEFAV
ncbi:MAG: class I SAM-dependent RNA methyltransferase [Kiritimatiellae bacterium]|nr:class I SAM-dependent RNA methyltransferase [Kiritimatiellia bacterium]